MDSVLAQERVRAYWNEKPCDSETSGEQPRSREYFLDIERKRYELQPPGIPNRFQLLENGHARLAHVGPDAFDEGVTPQVEPGEALLGQLPLDHILGGDAGVISAGLP